MTARVAWFSPLPPTRSGIAEYSTDLLPHLERRYTIETFDERRAHDFVWKYRRHAYDLVVYQMGNAPCHDYMWAYLAAYPGLVVLHDARLHHARARQLLQANRRDDYRHEFWYDHPDARKDAVEYAVEGLGGPIAYFWPMRRLVVKTARLIAVHNERVANELRQENTDAAIDVIRMGVPALGASDDARRTVRASCGIEDTATVFAAFGKMTSEKRLIPIVRALASLVAVGLDAHLVVVGDMGEAPGLRESIGPPLANRVHFVGYVAEDAVATYLAAADVCLCLRWPTALETSASWLRCLAAGRATVVSDLAHTADVPSSVALRVDLLNEDASLAGAMRALAANGELRRRIARAGHEWWRAHHTIEAMTADYARVLDRAMVRPAPIVIGLPRHAVDDYSEAARTRTAPFDVRIDDCWRG